MGMTASTFEQIINTAQDCVFWKDKQRRFVGANQAFLDFYGFESADLLIGKTDEDMGWHSDPEPFRQDELRVLAGESTYKVQGKCMVHGQERDIIASKRPLYGGQGEIIGLVGSFLDITDVMRRKNERELAQAMYTVERLRRYPYFDQLLDEVRLDTMLDSLTGIFTRAYILDFAKALIASGTPFTFTIVDLDNFKYINDTYGHHVGDLVLMNVAKELAECTDGYGVVGRFGGDELLVINLRDRSYEDKKRFFKELYEERRILRKNFIAGGSSLFVTGTSGCASYPEDAGDFDTLFKLIDKTLYRGKDKGRNCYVIYVEEKYGSLEIRDKVRHGVYTVIHQLIARADAARGFEEQLKALMPVLVEELRISYLYYVDAEGVMRSVSDAGMKEDVSDITQVMAEDLYTDSTIEGLRKPCPKLYAALERQKTCAVMMLRMELEGTLYGYLVCAEPRSQRLWQEDECGIMYFLARHLTACMHMHGKKI